MKPKQLDFSDFIDDFHKYIVIEKPKEDIYKMAYNQMPKTASADPNVKLQSLKTHPSP